MKTVKFRIWTGIEMVYDIIGNIYQNAELL